MAPIAPMSDRSPTDEQLLGTQGMAIEDTRPERYMMMPDTQKRLYSPQGAKLPPIQRQTAGPARPVTLPPPTDLLRLSRSGVSQNATTRPTALVVRFSATGSHGPSHPAAPPTVNYSVPPTQKEQLGLQDLASALEMNSGRTVHGWTPINALHLRPAAAQKLEPEPKLETTAGAYSALKRKRDTNSDSSNSANAPKKRTLLPEAPPAGFQRPTFSQQAAGAGEGNNLNLKSGSASLNENWNVGKTLSSFGLTRGKFAHLNNMLPPQGKKKFDGAKPASDEYKPSVKWVLWTLLAISGRTAMTKAEMIRLAFEWVPALEGTRDQTWRAALTGGKDGSMFVSIGNEMHRLRNVGEEVKKKAGGAKPRRKTEDERL